MSTTTVPPTRPVSRPTLTALPGGAGRRAPINPVAARTEAYRLIAEAYREALEIDGVSGPDRDCLLRQRRIVLQLARALPLSLAAEAN